MALMQEFIKEIYALGDEASLYCYGWWQEPNITVFLDRKMTNLEIEVPEKIDYDNGYFFIGQTFLAGTAEEIEEKLYESLNIELVKIDNIEVDPERISNKDTFSIYKIVRADKK